MEKTLNYLNTKSQSGVIAAVQAGRSGAAALLVERSGMLGGTMTVAGINFPAHFFARGKQVISGIGWELVKKTHEITGQPVPGPKPTDDENRPSPVDIPVLPT